MKLAKQVSVMTIFSLQMISLGNRGSFDPHYHAQITQFLVLLLIQLLQIWTLAVWRVQFGW